MIENRLHVQSYSSPWDHLVLGSVEKQLCFCFWASHPHIHPMLNRISCTLGVQVDETVSELLLEAEKQLQAYFMGKLRCFELPLLLVGTSFQKRVWKALTQLPYGAITTYQSVAVKLGKPSAVRAVAHAIGENPLQIIIPCHRVVRKDGSIGGYAGGIFTKHRLLAHEQALLL